MAASPRTLGKGLSALLSENAIAPVAANKAVGEGSGPGITSLSLSQIHAGTYQPRTRFDDAALADLAQSISRHGVMQPIIVRKSPKQAGKFEIVGGERRWRASQQAGMTQIPAIIREMSDKQALELAIVENVQRQDLGPLEEATGYQRLLEEFDYTQEELAKAVGKSRSHIANLLRLQSLPKQVKEMLDEGKLTMGHARALLTAENPVELALMIVAGNLSVRDAESFSKGSKKTADKKKGKTLAKAVMPKDEDILSLEESLSASLGLKVSINDRGQSGDITIFYDSLAQLDDILRRLGDSA